MEFQKFKKIIDIIRETDKSMNTLGDMGIVMIDSVLCKAYWELESLAFTEAYGEGGWEWIAWYLYDSPHMVEKETDNEVHAWRKDGSPIDLSNDEKLWEYLEAEFGQESGQVSGQTV